MRIDNYSPFSNISKTAEQRIKFLRPAVLLLIGDAYSEGKLLFSAFLPSPLGRVAERSEVGRGSLPQCICFAFFQKATPKTSSVSPSGCHLPQRGRQGAARTIPSNINLSHCRAGLIWPPAGLRNCQLNPVPGSGTHPPNFRGAPDRPGCRRGSRPG